jgi:hypothetical protein
MRPTRLQGYQTGLHEHHEILLMLWHSLHQHHLLQHCMLCAAPHACAWQPQREPGCTSAHKLTTLCQKQRNAARSC